MTQALNRNITYCDFTITKLYFPETEHTTEKNPESGAASFHRAAMVVNSKAHVHTGFD